MHEEMDQQDMSQANQTNPYNMVYVHYLLDLIFEPSFRCGKFLFYLLSLGPDAPWIIFICLLPLLLFLLPLNLQALLCQIPSLCGGLHLLNLKLGLSIIRQN